MSPPPPDREEEWQPRGEGFVNVTTYYDPIYREQERANRQAEFEARNYEPPTLKEPQEWMSPTT